MARGQKTDAETVARFRAEYLKLGNAARAARKIGVPVRTAQDWAKEADSEEEFTQLRAELYTREIAEVETLAADVARKSHARFCKAWDPPEPVEGGSVNIRDPRPDYGKLVMDALRSMSTHRAKLKDDQVPFARVEVELVKYRPPEEESATISKPDETADSEP